MYCKNCGAQIPAGESRCEKCGYEVPHNNQERALFSPAEKQSLSVSEENRLQKVPTQWSVWFKLAIASLCCGAFTFCEGLNKMFRYDSYDYVNAYVGGDAYNYIINGTYATAYFVLTAMFVLAAVGLIMIHYVSQKEES